MQLWTIQMGKWRLALAQGIYLLDSTVKSGVAAFAPTWEIVGAVKAGEITEQQYTEQYLLLMRESFRRQPEQWQALEGYPSIAVACYCKPGKFCHRHLLADMLTKYFTSRNIPVEFRGELLQ